MRFMVDYALQVACFSQGYVLAGRLEEASATRRACLRSRPPYKQRGHQARALRLLGEITARQDPPEVEPAEAHYRQALALAEELGMRPLGPTATSASARCMPRPASRSRPAPSCPRPSSCTAPWT